jgi:hypothetical protein
MRKYLFLAISVLCLSVIAHSQAIRITTDVGVYKFYANSTGDSLAASGLLIPIPYIGTAGDLLNNNFPDSIRVTCNTVTDTTIGKLYFKAWVNGGLANSSRDSVLNIAVHGFQNVLVPRSYYVGKDYMDLAYSAKTTTNGTTAGNTFYFRIERYFTPRRSY